MTRRATRHHFLASNLVVDLQLVAIFLIYIAGPVIHIEDLRFWPDEFLGLAVTFDAPFHLQRVFLKDRRHIVDLAVAGRTADSLCYVDTVIKICIFR